MQRRGDANGNNTHFHAVKVHGALAHGIIKRPSDAIF
jgi:hypothetical protein